MTHPPSDALAVYHCINDVSSVISPSSLSLLLAPRLFMTSDPFSLRREWITPCIPSSCARHRRDNAFQTQPVQYKMGRLTACHARASLPPPSTIPASSGRCQGNQPTFYPPLPFLITLVVACTALNSSATSRSQSIVRPRVEWQPPAPSPLALSPSESTSSSYFLASAL